MKSTHQDKNGGMLNLFWFLFCRFCLFLLSFRYRVKIKGFDKLKKSGIKQSILFLANHPAHMDPFFLGLLLWPTYRIRPLIIEYVYRLPLVRSLMNFVHAIVIPDFDTSINELKIQKGQKAIEEMVQSLEQGGNLLFYPSGRLKHTGKEILAGASGAYTLVQNCKKTQIVLIRTSGLWGSTFSRAFEGKSPDVLSVIINGIKTVFKNGIFFCPRRNVEIEIELNPKDLPRTGSKLEFNRYLENWYNRYPDSQGTIQEVEPLELVSYKFWRKEYPQVFEPKKKLQLHENVTVSDSIKKKITHELRLILQNPNLKVTPDQKLTLDLGLDSLNIAELISYMTKNYDVEELYPEDIETVQDVFAIAAGSASPRDSVRTKGEGQWPVESNRPETILPEGQTLPEAFFHICDRMGSFASCSDDLSGVISYKKMKQSALVLSLYFKKKPDKYIAIFLPASVAVYIVILAIQLAGKVPVMLNWTLGSRYLDEMMNLSGAKTVITSWRFLERLSHIEFGTLIDHIEYLEDIRQKLTIGDKLKGLFLSFQSTPFLLKFLNLNKIKATDPCVILFTSGTESNPKGVPLSHKNIISNQRAAMQCFDIHSTDILYGVLPPFHSFGFSVAGFFPIFCGLRIAFYPDPTDGFALAEGIERWNATLFCSPPSFLKGLFSVAKPEQLKTIRFFITGAEKAPDELFDRVEKLNSGAVIIEGYGITECSPILSISRLHSSHKGVGTPLPGIEICTIHLETTDVLPVGSEGEICVRGPNVFYGYLDHPRTPFIEIEGKQWYRTGDIGYLDTDGTLILSGRLKRFTKIGGEMISLGAIEESLSRDLLNKGQISSDVPALAVCSDEQVPGKPRLILFSIIPLEEEEINETLKKQGFSRLIKISKVMIVDEIPLMGSGKKNYRKLQSLLT